MSDNVADALVGEMARVRDEVLPAYLEIGPPGVFAASMMRAVLSEAAQALAEGSAVRCIRALRELQGYQT